jgi:hypothetical protein
LSEASTSPLTAAHITYSRGLADWLRANRVSLAFTSYQAGRLHLVGVDDAGGLAIYEVGTGRAMGLWADRSAWCWRPCFSLAFRKHPRRRHRAMDPYRGRDDRALPGVRRPLAASFTGPEINEPMTFEM